MLQTVSQNVGMKRSAISVRTGALGAQRPAEIPVHDAVDEAHELLRQRAVEAEILAHELDGLRIRIRPRREARRIAGQQMDEQEDERADDERASAASPSRRLAMY